MMKLEELKIDPEFDHMTPKLTRTEWKTLEENILSDGAVSEPIVIWNGFIVDGHNRYKILQKHPEIPFETVERNFDNRYAVLAWICKNQIGRRNMNPQNMKYLVGKRYENERLARGGHRNQKKGEEDQMGQNDPLDHGTRSMIAKDIGRSESYVKRAYEVSQGVDYAETVSPGFESDYRKGKIQATDQEIAIIRKVSPDERPELVAELKKPPGERRKIALPVLKEKVMPDRVYISSEEAGTLSEQERDSVSLQETEQPIPPSDTPTLAEILKHKHFSGVTNIPEQTENHGRPESRIMDQPIEESVLHSMHLAVVHLMESFNNYFYRFPALLEDPRYRDRSVAVVKEFETYISQIEKGVKENEAEESART